jgi:cyclic pyranopterin phosphate synthase
MSPFDLGGAGSRTVRRLPLLDGRRFDERRAESQPASSSHDAHESSKHAPVERVGPRSVRLSVTDRCDFACTYCRPSRSDGYADVRLSLDEWAVIVDALIASGVRRFRFTGGEPLVHPAIVELVRLVASRGIDDLALTTNGSQLERLAGPLKAAGLQRINVSIDTLDPARFRAITRGGELAPVLAGLDAARSVGLGPIKLNAVVLRGVNDDELRSITEFAWANGFVPRFLEIMPIAEGARLVGEHLVSAAEMRARLGELLVDEQAQPEPDRGPARYVASATDPRLRVGFITGTSDTYCGSCDRLRVSSSGTLRPCLATDDGVEARDAARSGDVEDIRRRVAQAWNMKPDGQVWRGCTEESAARVSMRAIGG